MGVGQKVSGLIVPSLVLLTSLITFPSSLLFSHILLPQRLWEKVCPGVWRGSCRSDRVGPVRNAQMSALGEQLRGDRGSEPPSLLTSSSLPSPL